MRLACRRRLARGLPAAVGAAAMLLAAAVPAPASFPGRNGQIAVSSAFGCRGDFIQAMWPWSGRLSPLTASTCRDAAAPPSAIDPSYSKDGERIVFSMCCADDPDYKGYFLAMMDADGTNQRRLPFGWVHHPRLSPDGRRLVFARTVPGQAAREVWIADIDGSGQRRLRLGSSPAFSPDGRWIAYVASIVYPRGELRPRAQWGLWVMRSDGSGRRRLAGGDVYEGIDWHPDGRRIFFSRRTGRRPFARFDLFSVRRDGSARRRVTRTRRRTEREPTVSPDGRWVAFIRVVERRGLSHDVIRAERIGVRRPGRSRRLRALPDHEPDSNPTALAWRPRPRR